MTDLLLKFPNEEAAGQVGAALGCAFFEDGKWQFATNHKVAICAIGEHFISTGKILKTENGDISEIVSDGNFWAMARIMVEMETPHELAPFIIEPNAEDDTHPKRVWA